MVKMNHKSLPERTADGILNYIQCNSCAAGSKLPNEHELAEYLEVGRNTIREAIQILAAKNILEVRRGSGTYVSGKMGVSDDPLGLSLAYDKEKMIHDLLVIRTLIEPKMAALAAQNASAKERELLMHNCREMEELFAQKKSYLLKDLEFHALIAAASKNTVVHNMLPSIQQALLLQHNIPEELLGEKTLQAHRKIAQSIYERRASDAEDAMLLHLIQNKERIENSI